MHYKSWILANLPEPVAPYVEMTRVGFLPTGVLVPFLPVFVSLLHVAAVSGLPSAQVVDSCLKWLFVSWFYAAYGCVVDDIADKDLDSKVDRCQHRPMVRGAVSVPSGILFAACLAGFNIYLTRTFFPGQPDIHIPIVIVGSIIYPFIKRFSNFALAWLALLYALTGFNASRTSGFDVLSASEPILRSSLFLAAANYVCNITVETIYMHADVEDDIKAGIGSTAVAIKGYSKPVLFLASLLFGGLLAATGIYAEFGAYYFTGATLAALMLYTLVARVDLTNSKQCEVYFFLGNAVINTTLAGGLLAEYAYA
ncbi:UbiA prenyltransferase family [Aspergillus californicus]